MQAARITGRVVSDADVLINPGLSIEQFTRKRKERTHQVQIKDVNTMGKVFPSPVSFRPPIVPSISCRPKSPFPIALPVKKIRRSKSIRAKKIVIERKSPKTSPKYQPLAYIAKRKQRNRSYNRKPDGKDEISIPGKYEDIPGKENIHFDPNNEELRPVNIAQQRELKQALVLKERLRIKEAVKFLKKQQLERQQKDLQTEKKRKSMGELQKAIRDRNKKLFYKKSKISSLSVPAPCFINQQLKDNTISRERAITDGQLKKPPVPRLSGQDFNSSKRKKVAKDNSAFSQQKNHCLEQRPIVRDKPPHELFNYRKKQRKNLVEKKKSSEELHLIETKKKLNEERRLGAREFIRVKNQQRKQLYKKEKRRHANLLEARKTRLERLEAIRMSQLKKDHRRFRTKPKKEARSDNFSSTPIELNVSSYSYDTDSSKEIVSNAEKFLGICLNDETSETSIDNVLITDIMNNAEHNLKKLENTMAEIEHDINIQQVYPNNSIVEKLPNFDEVVSPQNCTEGHSVSMRAGGHSFPNQNQDESLDSKIEGTVGPDGGQEPTQTPEMKRLLKLQEIVASLSCRVTELLDDETGSESDDIVSDHSDVMIENKTLTDPGAYLYENRTPLVRVTQDNPTLEDSPSATNEGYDTNEEFSIHLPVPVEESVDKNIEWEQSHELETSRMYNSSISNRSGKEISIKKSFGLEVNEPKNMNPTESSLAKLNSLMFNNHDESLQIVNIIAQEIYKERNLQEVDLNSSQLESVQPQPVEMSHSSLNSNSDIGSHSTDIVEDDVLSTKDYPSSVENGASLIGAEEKLDEVNISEICDEGYEGIEAKHKKLISPEKLTYNSDEDLRPNKSKVIIEKFRNKKQYSPHELSRQLLAEVDYQEALSEAQLQLLAMEHMQYLAETQEKNLDLIDNYTQESETLKKNENIVKFSEDDAILNRFAEEHEENVWKVAQLINKSKVEKKEREQAQRECAVQTQVGDRKEASTNATLTVNAFTETSPFLNKEEQKTPNRQSASTNTMTTKGTNMLNPENMLESSAFQRDNQFLEKGNSISEDFNISSNASQELSGAKIVKDRSVNEEVNRDDDEDFAEISEIVVESESESEGPYSDDFSEGSNSSKEEITSPSNNIRVDKTANGTEESSVADEIVMESSKSTSSIKSELNTANPENDIIFSGEKAIRSSELSEEIALKPSKDLSKSEIYSEDFSIDEDALDSRDKSNTSSALEGISDQYSQDFSKSSPLKLNPSNTQKSHESGYPELFEETTFKKNRDNGSEKNEVASLKTQSDVEIQSDQNLDEYSDSFTGNSELDEVNAGNTDLQSQQLLQNANYKSYSESSDSKRAQLENEEKSSTDEPLMSSSKLADIDKASDFLTSSSQSLKLQTIQNELDHLNSVSEEEKKLERMKKTLHEKKEKANLMMKRKKQLIDCKIKQLMVKEEERQVNQLAYTALGLDVKKEIKIAKKEIVREVSTMMKEAVKMTVKPGELEHSRTTKNSMARVIVDEGKGDVDSSENEYPSDSIKASFVASGVKSETSLAEVDEEEISEGNFEEDEISDRDVSEDNYSDEFEDSFPDNGTPNKIKDHGQNLDDILDAVRSESDISEIKSINENEEELYGEDSFEDSTKSDIKESNEAVNVTTDTTPSAKLATKLETSSCDLMLEHVPTEANSKSEEVEIITKSIEDYQIRLKQLKDKIAARQEEAKYLKVKINTEAIKQQLQREEDRAKLEIEVIERDIVSNKEILISMKMENDASKANTTEYISTPFIEKCSSKVNFSELNTDLEECTDRSYTEENHIVMNSEDSMNINVKKDFIRECSERAPDEVHDKMESTRHTETEARHPEVEQTEGQYYINNEDDDPFASSCDEESSSTKELSIEGDSISFDCDSFESSSSLSQELVDESDSTEQPLVVGSCENVNVVDIHGDVYLGEPSDSAVHNALAQSFMTVEDEPLDLLQSFDHCEEAVAVNEFINSIEESNSHEKQKCNVIEIFENHATRKILLQSKPDLLHDYLYIEDVLKVESTSKRSIKYDNDLLHSFAHIEDAERCQYGGSAYSIHTTTFISHNTDEQLKPISNLNSSIQSPGNFLSLCDHTEECLPIKFSVEEVATTHVLNSAANSSLENQLSNVKKLEVLHALNVRQDQADWVMGIVLNDLLFHAVQSCSINPSILDNSANSTVNEDLGPDAESGQRNQIHVIAEDILQQLMEESWTAIYIIYWQAKQLNMKSDTTPFIVKSALSHGSIDWAPVNRKYCSIYFEYLESKYPTKKIKDIIPLNAQQFTEIEKIYKDSLSANVDKIEKTYHKALFDYIKHFSLQFSTFMNGDEKNVKDLKIFVMDKLNDTGIFKSNIRTAMTWKDLCTQRDKELRDCNLLASDYMSKRIRNSSSSSDHVNIDSKVAEYILNDLVKELSSEILGAQNNKSF